MTTQARELYSLLIPLKRERLLVPRMCVAEVITFADIQAPTDGRVADWFLGTVDWNGRRVPVVSFDTDEFAAGSDNQNRMRIVILHAITNQLRSRYYGILTQGFPQLVRVNPDVLGGDAEQELPDQLPALCRVRLINDYPLIPDVERIEAWLGEVAS